MTVLQFSNEKLEVFFPNKAVKDVIFLLLVLPALPNSRGPFLSLANCCQPSLGSIKGINLAAAGKVGARSAPALK